MLKTCFIFCIFCILLIEVASATNFKEYSVSLKEYQRYERIKLEKVKTNDLILLNLSKTVQKRTVEGTIKSVYSFSINYVDYEFFWTPRPIKSILRYRRGDCSDRAELMFYLLAFNGIPSRRMKGYLNKQKHDYLEVLMPCGDYVCWRPIESNVTKYGIGYW